MKDEPNSRIATAAAEWMIRCESGLTAQEQDDFCDWLAADPRHGDELALQRKTWKRLDQLVEWRPEHGARPNPDLLARPLKLRIVRVVPWAVGLAAAAAVAFLFRPSNSTPIQVTNVVQVAAPAAMAATTGPMVLEDGSIVELNEGAKVTVHFTETERRVSLERGEAHFAVTKNPARPFIVSAGGIDVRAVGTAFNVSFGKAGVEVLVTEGRVQVDTARVAAIEELQRPERAMVPPLVPMLTARQRVIVSTATTLDSPQIEIATLSLGEIDRVLAWQHRMLEFNSTPLADVVLEFNRRNVVQLVVVDPELNAVGISGRFRTDNIDLLLSLLEKQFGVHAEQRADTEISLKRAGSGSR